MSPLWLAGVAGFSLIAMVRWRLMKRRGTRAGDGDLPVPVLFRLPEFRHARREAAHVLRAYLDPDEPVFIDVLRQLRSRLVLAAADGRGWVLVMGIENPGASTVLALNLALALGQLGRVLYLAAVEGAERAEVRVWLDRIGAAGAGPGACVHAWKTGMIDVAFDDDANTQGLWARWAERAAEYEWVIVDVGLGVAAGAVLASAPEIVSALLALPKDVAATDPAWARLREQLPYEGLGRFLGGIRVPDIPMLASAQA